MKERIADFRRGIPPTLLLAYLFAFFSLIHAGPRGLTERDGYFHARYAQMMPQRGLSRRFPWTQASPWKFRFADKELLFHVLLAPFARGAEPIRGALFFSVLLSTAAFAAFYFFLAANKVRGPTFFTFILASMGGPFLLRMSFLRAHVLSVLLIILALHFLVRGKWKPLAVLGFFYSWSYSFPFLLPLIALPVLAGKALSGEKFDRRCLGAVLGGVLLGLVVHPYTPYSLESVATYFDVLLRAAGPRGLAAVEVGREFAPYSTRSFLIAFPLLTAALSGLGVAGWATKKKLSAEALGLICAAGAAGLAAMVYMRAIEYAAPLAAAALAFTVRDILDKPAITRLRESFRRTPGAAWAITAVLMLLIGGAHFKTLSYCFRLSADNDPPRFRQAAQWMENNLVEEETVVNLWWDDFPDLFYSGHRQRYVVGLDPTYLLKHNRDNALRLEAMRLGRLPIDASWLAETYAARYMILRTRNARFYPQLTAGGWKPAYADRHAAIFALTGPGGPPKYLQGLPQIPALP